MDTHIPATPQLNRPIDGSLLNQESSVKTMSHVSHRPILPSLQVYCVSLTSLLEDKRSLKSAGLTHFKNRSLLVIPPHLHF